MKLDRYKNHDIEVVIDKTVVTGKEEKRLHQSVSTAMRQGDGLLMIWMHRPRAYAIIASV